MRNASRRDIWGGYSPIADGKIAAAGLDAIEYEPISMDNPLLQAKNCVITPHISWAALECRQRLNKTSIENVRNFISGNPTNLVY